MKILYSLGRFLYAVPFLGFGIIHFLRPSNMAKQIEFLPFAEGLVYITGLALLLAAISIVINFKARLTTLLLALYLLLTAVIIHLPDAVNLVQGNVTALLKDVGLMGAALTYSGILKK
ncbi:MAG: DoxX family membrane protein [Bacteroidales bacterium]|nr:DoxX family membrane protein [Bacteroidales bacterium]